MRGALLSLSDLTAAAFHSPGQTQRCRKVAAVIMIPFVLLCLSEVLSGANRYTYVYFLFLNVVVVVSGVFLSTKTRRYHKFHGSVAAGSGSE